MNGQSLAKKYSVFSWNSKIGKNAIALNFSRSGGGWCSDSCLHKRNGTCYAIASQGLYKTLYAKLERHEQNGFVWVLQKAIDAIEGNPKDFEGLKFFRFCTHGSVPFKPFTREEKLALVRLGEVLRENDVMIHFPVETREKYNEVLACGIQPRLSFQGRIEHAKRSTEAVSVSVGSMEQKPVERLNQSIMLSLKLTYTGKTVAVCPAIAGKIAKSDEKVTCDLCGLCARSEPMVIIYPQH